MPCLHGWAERRLLIHEEYVIRRVYSDRAPADAGTVRLPVRLEGVLSWRDTERQPNQGQEGDARTQDGNASKRNIRQESEKPQTSDRHRAIGSSACGRQSAVEEVVIVQKVFFQEIFEEIVLEEVVQEIRFEEVRFKGIRVDRPTTC